jgi:hydrogenase maturation protein HypF
MQQSPAPCECRRLRVIIRGAVQGVGFRPFVYRLATELALPGWVSNSSRGVLIEVEGAPDHLTAFLLRLERERPPRSAIYSLESSFLPPQGFSDFTIRESDGTGRRTAIVLPDIATCADCLRDIFDPANRRHRYPFTNCTNCGPRFTIITALPYDRAGTTMRAFRMCRACEREYHDPADRRFHAQPNACPACGPQLALWDEHGRTLAVRHEALLRAAERIRAGQIVALKGIGGFHLLVDARSEEAVHRLRARKHREEKPLALMYPSLAQITADSQVSPLEQRLLRAPEAPIVLVRRRASRVRRSDADAGTEVAPAVAPGNPYLGVMLPYSPLHHLLLRELPFPLVATSGNLSDEPICTDEHEALERLQGVADAFLVHDRPIARHADDSVARVLLGREQVLRRARGYAPLPIHVGSDLPSLLGVGGHLKGAVAVSVGDEVFVSQHLGDLESAEASRAFQRAVDDLERLYALRPAAVACDAHPDYFSTRYARSRGLPVIPVQHHHAHLRACMAENGLRGPALGVSWDGTGYGLDGTVWGGEFLHVTSVGFRRAAHLRPFRLPGAEQAIREPRRAAVGMLYEVLGDQVFSMEHLPPVAAFTRSEREVLRQMLARGVNCPRTSSAGRLFDAVAALLGLHLGKQFEGQAAMELEWTADAADTATVYPFGIRESEGALLVDWEPILRAILAGLESRVAPAQAAATFHNTLAEMIVAVAARIGEQQVLLSGGCFQNRVLTEATVSRLTAAGFSPYWHQRIPPNDGGIALGQIIAACAAMEEQACALPSPDRSSA